MRYDYDTEFHERGGKFAIEAISIGIVAEDGREYYAVYDDFDTRAVAKNEWLMKNVMSSIGHQAFVVSDFLGMPMTRDIYVDDPACKPRWQIAEDIMNFTRGDDDIQWWNWYGAYDHVVLYQTFGTMMDRPGNYPMWSNDIKSLHKEAGYPEMPRQPKGKHNALDDARFNTVRYNYLRGLLLNGTLDS